MQNLSWYVRRLASMTPAEVLWRAKGAARDGIDALRFAAGYAPGRALRPRQSWADTMPAFRASPTQVGELKTLPVAARWVQDLERAAALIQAHRLTFFDLEGIALGTPIDWQRDHASDRAGRMQVIQRIDYRDFATVGDCKLVWEPNRHHQLVVLARAYRATGRTAYAASVAEILADWLSGNPFGRGMTWRSPLELGLRLINWTWALDMIKESGMLDAELWQRVYASVYQHCWEITRKYSRGSSANNHLIGEAAGVFVASAYFRDLPHAARWREQAAAILEQEIERQSFSDGCTREHALGYQCFVAQFFLVCRQAAQAIGAPMSAVYDQRLAQMIDFLITIGRGGPLPMFGDRDDGYVLDLGEPPDDLDAWRAIRALMFERPGADAELTRVPECAYWLCGRKDLARLQQLPSTAPKPLASQHFDSGYALLQCGEGHCDSLSIFFDYAELGYGSIAAHGHADALSITVRACGAEVLVDPGTYDYFTYPAWRSYFRSTAAHNTVRVDGVDQSQMQGPFMWGRRAQARLLAWSEDSARVTAQAEHDGYTRLADPVLHRRELDLDKHSQTLRIQDLLECQGLHDVELFFHLAPECAVEPCGASRFTLHVAGRALELELDASLEAVCVAADEHNPIGWVSRGYHRRTPSHTIVARRRIEGTTRFTSTLSVARDNEPQRETLKATDTAS
jgi:hypothetical protein